MNKIFFLSFMFFGALRAQADYTDIPPPGGGGVQSVTASSPLSSSGGTNPNISCATASGSQAGCLASTDWTTFNGKFGNPGADRNVYVGNGYSTIQAAVNYAETLAGSANGDLSGVTVWVPSGVFNETVTINKNVNLVGTGAGTLYVTAGNTQVTEIDVRPSSSSAQPDSVRIDSLYVETLVVSNQTTASSGIYNTSDNFLGTGLMVNNSAMASFNITNAMEINFFSTVFTGAATDPAFISQNTDTVGFYNCTVFGQNYNYTMNSAAVNTLVHPGGLDGSLNFYNGFALPSFNLITTAGSTWLATLEAWNSFIYQFSIGSLSQAGFRNSGTFSYTIDPAAGSVSINSLQGYTPATSTDWTNQPTNVDSALDELASLDHGQSASSFMSFASGLTTVLTANEILASGLTVRPMTIENLVGAASTLNTCSTNPTIKLFDCGTSTGACTSGATLMATLTLSATNTTTNGTIQSANIDAGHYWAYLLTAGACISISVNGSAEAVMQ